MPVDEIVPASGSGVVAAAQVLDQKVLIVKSADFALGLFNGSVLSLTRTYVANLPEIRIGFFLYPEYDRGDFTFQARNYIAWRVVASNPGDLPPIFTGLVETPWVPVTTPQLLPVGQPIDFKLCCAGFDLIAVEFDTSSQFPNVLQGEDQVLITISASQ